jgi:hypothetical protein
MKPHLHLCFQMQFGGLALMLLLLDLEEAVAVGPSKHLPLLSYPTAVAVA